MVTLSNPGEPSQGEEAEGSADLAAPRTVLVVGRVATLPGAVSQLESSSLVPWRWLRATTADAAIALLRSHSPDLALIDLSLPDEASLRVIETLVALTFPTPGAIVVLVEAGAERLALEAMKRGAVDYLFKDEITADTLGACLDQAWANVQAHHLARQHTAQALNRAQQRYQNLVENSPDIIERFDLNLRHLYVSSALTSITGIPTETFLGKSCRELGLDEAMVNAWEAAAATLIATGEKQAIEFSTSTLQGLRHFELVMAPEWDDGHTLSSILCISRDITDRIVAQQAQTQLLAEAEAARAVATATQTLLTTVFDRIHDGIVALDTNHCFTYINHRAAQILNRSAAELLGHNVWATFPEALNQPFYSTFNQAVEQQHPIYEEQFYQPYDRWFENRFYPSADGITIYFTDITDRKAAEVSRLQTEKLRFELTLLEHTLEAVLAGYWDIDFQQGTAYMSPGLKRMVGYTDEALPNAPDVWQQLIVPDDLPSTLACQERHIQSHGAEPYYTEVRYRHRDGSTVWGICAGKVVQWDEAGQPLYMVGCLVDITQLKQTKAQLQRSEAHLQAAQRIGNLGSWEFEWATEQITWSDQLYRLFGLEVGAVPANFEELQRYFHPDDRDRHRQFVEALIATRQPYDQEFRVIRPDGTLVYLQVKGEAVVNSTGAVTHLTGTALDITPRKQAEAQLQALSLRLALALESGQIGSWEMDMVTLQVDWDQRMYDIYGLPYPGPGVTFSDWRDRVHLGDVERVDAGFAGILEGRPPSNLEFRIWRGDGERRWIKATALVQRNGQGQPVRLIGTNADITEAKRAEEQFVSTSARLEASNRELETFAYSVSHDLRAPLRAIDGFSRALLEDYGDQFDPEGQDYFDRIRHNVKRMGLLIDDLLRLSRVSRATMASVAVDLSELVRQHLQELQELEPERRLTLAIAPQLTVWADPTLIQVAIANLVQNAWKFTSHHPTAYIEFGTIEQNGQPVYYLRDDGAGFDMAYADKLFGVFQRLHNTDEFPGTGIGLATVQRVIHRHGGRVWAKAAIEQGTTVYFTVPPPSQLQEPRP